MSNGRVLLAGNLLGTDGTLEQSGYAFSQALVYDRAAVKGSRLRIKEWDYYYFGDEDRAIALTVADNGYMSLGSVSVLDFSHLSYITKSKIGLFPRGRLNMPASCATGDVAFEKGGLKLDFKNADGVRKLVASFEKFDGKRDFSCELELEKPSGDNITTAVPFKKRRQFYYNTKINCLAGKGRYKLGDEVHEFVNGYGGLDWGRGVWPYKSEWFWSSLSTEIDGVPFGLNLGYGFGERVASENVIFRDGKAHKLGEVKFEIPYTIGEIDYLKPWHISDDEERLQLIFYPMIDRKDEMNIGLLSSIQHQVFGKFYGKATLDDGTIIVISDRMGFAEHVRNKW